MLEADKEEGRGGGVGRGLCGGALEEVVTVVFCVLRFPSLLKNVAGPTLKKIKLDEQYSLGVMLVVAFLF